MSNMAVEKRGDDYNPLSDDLPRVQIPLGRDTPGLTIDGDFTPYWSLPPKAQEAYLEYHEKDGETRIWRCDNCGYLTDAKALHASTYNKAYECGGCGERLRGTTQHGSSGSTTRVVGPYTGPGDENYVDVDAVVPDSKCGRDHGPTIEEEAPDRRGRSFGTATVNEAAVECPECVPNHPSHLGKLRNRAGGPTRSEMMKRVAEAVREFREA